MFCSNGGGLKKKTDEMEATLWMRRTTYRRRLTQRAHVFASETSAHSPAAITAHATSSG